MNRTLFFVCCVACLAPLVARGEAAALVAPAALLAGAALALTLGNPYPKEAKKVGRPLLQTAVVLLGFSMPLKTVAEAGARGFGLALVSITLVLGLGYVLGRALGVRRQTGLLVSAGTAICGGSAIAAVASVTDAPDEDVSVAVGTVFLLNAVALVLFPPLGRALGLSPVQFGEWAGVAIHDVASVAGAGAAFGGGALEVATAVKLSRVLYLVPLVLFLAWRGRRSGAGTAWPWFVGLFVLASAARSLVPSLEAVAPSIKVVAACGFALCLFLIGAGLSRASLKAVGPRPLALGLLLWLAISLLSLAAVRATG